jgi:nitrogen fixation NifU-like protein
LRRVLKLYSEKVIEHFMCPRNARSMPDADGEGTMGDAKCGDTLNIYIKVGDGIIKDISFLVFGCTASIATSSMTTVLAKGKTLEEAMKISEQDVIDALDGLPEEKKHCSNLGVSALKNAIQNYLGSIVSNEVERSDANKLTNRVIQNILGE